MEHPLAADRAEEERCLPGRAEDLDAQVRHTDVDETARTQLEASKAVAIPLHRQVLVHAGAHVAPVRGRQRAPGRLLEIHQRDRVSRGVEGEGKGGWGRCGWWGGRGLLNQQQRAGGEELEKAAAVAR